KRRRRIDRSMIGEPTNFVHTAHVGSGDLFSGMNSHVVREADGVILLNGPLCDLQIMGLEPEVR
ncbi:hypothetical protein JZ751_011919, partial [Albula glossodonta]